MAVTLNFALGPVCSGGNHVGVVATLATPQGNKVFSYSRDRESMFAQPARQSAKQVHRSFL